VRDVIGCITVKQPTASAVDVKPRIERALARAAEIAADQIRMGSKDGHVILNRTVRSWSEKRESDAAAWRARGVTQVTNDIEVRPS
jgi:osmotically-inducible protein OsmY